MTTHDKDQRIAPMTFEYLRDQHAAWERMQRAVGKSWAEIDSITDYVVNRLNRSETELDALRSRHHLEIDCTDEVVTIFCRACKRQQSFQGKITEWPGIVAGMREIMNWPHHHEKEKP